MDMVAMEPESKLIRRVRRPFALRHPRWFAGVWFGVLGAIPGAVLCVLHMVFDGGYVSRVAIVFTLLGGISAFLSGAKCGASILFETPRRSRMHGITVVALANLLFCAIPCCWFAVQMCSEGHWSGILVALFAFAGCTAFITLVGGLVTFPIGIIGAWLLAIYRKRIERPSGCLIHGYRSDTTYGAEQNIHNRIRADL
jgi:hypothetical protein